MVAARNLRGGVVRDPVCEKGKEREIHFFKSKFVCVNAGGRIHLLFLESL